MRFIALFGVLLFVCSAAGGQTWPSDAQVLRDVYGRVDAGGTSVRWDAARESKPSPYVGHSFADTGQEMGLAILLRAEVDGRVYVATSAVPKVPEEYKCHACVAALGGAVYGRANGVWKLEAASPAAIYAGGWGEPPAGIELRQCSERMYCFVVEDGFTGQGYTDVSLKIFGPVGGSVQALLTVPVESDNDGAYDRKGVDGTAVWKRMSAGVRFEVSNARSPFWDVELTGVTRKCSRGRCTSLLTHARYRYQDGEYSAAEFPVVPAD